jgi:hypothetical protein
LSFEKLESIELNIRYTILIVAILANAWYSASAQNHLEPEEGILNELEFRWEHRKRIREVLLKGAAFYHVARMVCIPAFRPEWVVTVVQEEAEDADTPDSYYVEYVAVDKKLFPPNANEKLTVKKERAVLARETAEALNTTWRRILRSTRYSRNPRIGADGVGYHFSRGVPLKYRDGGFEQGQIWTPVQSSPCGELVAIGEALRDYACAKPDKRDEARTVLRTRIEQLRASLDRLNRLR